MMHLHEDCHHIMRVIMIIIMIVMSMMLNEDNDEMITFIMLMMKIILLSDYRKFVLTHTIKHFLFCLHRDRVLDRRTSNIEIRPERMPFLQQWRDREKHLPSKYPI